MSKFGTLLILASFLSQNANAASQLICKASGAIDGITSIHAEDSNSEPKICVAINEGTKSEKVNCSQGSIMDSTVEVSSNLEIGKGTTKTVIVKTETTSQPIYTLKQTFTCDWSNDEEHCSISAPEKVLQTEALDCQIVRE